MTTIKTRETVVTTQCSSRPIRSHYAFWEEELHRDRK